jgi:hypothetical protein
LEWHVCFHEGEVLLLPGLDVVKLLLGYLLAGREGQKLRLSYWGLGLGFVIGVFKGIVAAGYV